MQLPKLVQKFILFILPWLCPFFAHGQTLLIQKEQHKLHTLKDSTIYVNCLNRIGMLYHLKNPDSCFSYGFKAKAIATRIGYVKGQDDADNTIGVALYLKGLYSESLGLFGKVLSAYQQRADTMAAVNVLMNLSTVYLKMADTTKAVSFCRKAIYLGKRLPRDSCMSVVYANYCIVNPSLSKDSLRYYLDKSELIATRYKDERMLIVLQQLNARRLLNQGQLQQVLPIIQQSMLASRAAGLEYLEIGSLDLYATYYSSKPDSVLTYYNRINELVNAKGYTYLKVKVLQVIVYYEQLKGNKDKQISISKLLTAALAAENESVKKFIGDYVKYNAIQNDNRLLKLNEKNSKVEIWLLITVCIVISFLLLVIYRLYHVSRKQNQDLQKADEFKNTLISILAHDFRSPLISTIAIARMMKEKQDFSPAEMEIFYGSIETDAQAMLQSFDTILQWIKQQLSGYQYKAETLSLYDMMQEASAIYNTMLETKKIKIENHIPQDVTVTSDKEMLQFINRNLLSNAIRFSPEGSTIKISAVQSNGEFIISVEDNGPGINANVIGKLFSISKQASLATTQDGAGIALSMCRDIIQKLGGRIWAENKATNGATFFYTIPN